VTVEADQPVQVRLTDSTGCTASATDLLEVGGVAGPPPPDAPLHGLRELEVHAPQGAVVRRVTVDYSRPAGQGLLARYGLRSNHPLDGKSPVTGAPTHYWSGTVWAPYAWHAAHALAGCGESELAQELARGYLDGVRRAFALGRVAPEHHCADTGTGMGADRQAWTAAVALLLAEELLGEEPLVAAPEHQVRGTP
jgi:glycogen debranching enzyme